MQPRLKIWNNFLLKTLDLIHIVYVRSRGLGRSLLQVHDKTLGAITPTASVGFSMSKERATRRNKELVLNYVSKRRVPNGPDPIHNRKVTNTRQPPERA
ncbi:hypothetical protein QVD17_09733 [Tagetes erecta]|uniref:Uncharacterized protein n=1 Tax=Tagetes erecta TaxID=13708 RepID=A0AAD8L574_TARER|nr:hypothetical protein QVD17_09733 [Tagetes erecta]